ncbi:copper chaperone PCu(A)C [Acuticoccus sp. MNP-M23]|uniref:copper chaperone PCu(A)C n=1 Tax=Acuticoccus sp. MNP-M23 TaxID=3072793 RepID=UPI0035BF5C47
MNIQTGLAVATLLFAMSAMAVAGSSDVVVENAWARASIGTSRPGAAYMMVRNAGAEAVTLIGIETPAAGMAEIHRTATDSRGVSSMSPAGDIEIGPGEAAKLEPGGLHGMLMGLRTPLKQGDSFDLTLRFADGGTVAVAVPVLGIAARGPGR